MMSKNWTKKFLFLSHALLPHTLPQAAEFLDETPSIGVYKTYDKSLKRNGKVYHSQAYRPVAAVAGGLAPPPGDPSISINITPSNDVESETVNPARLKNILKKPSETYGGGKGVMFNPNAIVHFADSVSDKKLNEFSLGVDLNDLFNTIKEHVPEDMLEKAIDEVLGASVENYADIVPIEKESNLQLFCITGIPVEDPSEKRTVPNVLEETDSDEDTDSTSTSPNANNELLIEEGQKKQYLYNLFLKVGPGVPILEKIGKGYKKPTLVCLRYRGTNAKEEAYKLAFKIWAYYKANEKGSFHEDFPLFEDLISKKKDERVPQFSQAVTEWTKELSADYKKIISDAFIIFKRQLNGLFDFGYYYIEDVCTDDQVRSIKCFIDRDYVEDLWLIRSITQLQALYYLKSDKIPSRLYMPCYSESENSNKLTLIPNTLRPSTTENKLKAVIDRIIDLTFTSQFSAVTKKLAHMLSLKDRLLFRRNYKKNWSKKIDHKARSEIASRLYTLVRPYCIIVKDDGKFARIELEELALRVFLSNIEGLLSKYKSVKRTKAKRMWAGLKGMFCF